MKKYLILFLIVSFTLLGCNKKDDIVKGEYDIKGKITEVDPEGNRILVDDKNSGLVWVTLPKEDTIKTYQKDQEVAVWVDGGIRESHPAQADALNIELITPDEK